MRKQHGNDPLDYDRCTTLSILPFSARDTLYFSRAHLLIVNSPHRGVRGVRNAGWCPTYISASFLQTRFRIPHYRRTLASRAEICARARVCTCDREIQKLLFLLLSVTSPRGRFIFRDRRSFRPDAHVWLSYKAPRILLPLFHILLAALRVTARFVSETPVLTSDCFLVTGSPRE